MQYLLTQEELDNSVPRADLTERDHALAVAREKILTLSGHNCIHSDAGKNRGGYCDDCPCSSAANGWDGVWDRICWLSKHYSK